MSLVLLDCKTDEHMVHKGYTETNMQNYSSLDIDDVHSDQRLLYNHQ